jgi:hypothetical protein
MNMDDDNQSPNSESPQEPSVLDYIKSKLSFGRGPHIEIPEYREIESEVEINLQSKTADLHQTFLPSIPIPWLSLAALGLALFAQLFFEPPNPSALVGIGFYLVAFGFLLMAVLRGQWVLAPLAGSSSGSDPLSFRPRAFVMSVPFAILAFLFFTGNLFTGFNLMLWFIALGLFIWSLWLRHPGSDSLWKRLRAFLARERWAININRWTVLLLAATVIVVFFRVYHLQQTPAEPFSDHAEKLLDVYDVSQGQTHIFFPRNTGREAIQMYWTLLMSWVFGTGISFLSLKIGTVLLGLFILPYIYLLGKELASPRVGLLAFFLAGIGFWPNIISRIGLRFPLYPLFVAPLLLYLIRGLRTRNRNDFILAGIFLGLGLHGYTPYRIVPFLVIAALILYILHAQSKGARQDALLWLVIVGLTSLIIFLPLLRYATENPEMFSYRTLSRLVPGQSLPSPWYQILLSNTWNALKLFNWNDGNIWVNSLPNRPGLDVVSGAMFLIGVVLLLVRYIRGRHWQDLFLLISIPILLLPSILSLAFPDENPAMNRSAGALVPAFIIIALALDGLITAFERSPAGATLAGSLPLERPQKNRVFWAYALTGVLLFASAAQNFDIVFHQFDEEYRLGSWNSSEMGAIIKEFGLIYGETDTVWVVPFPYWVDTRLPGVWAGIPNRDFAMWPQDLSDTVKLTGPKLFIVKANIQDPSSNDQKSLDSLNHLYPQGALSLHTSPVPGHDFWIFFVPPQ